MKYHLMILNQRHRWLHACVCLFLLSISFPTSAASDRRVGIGVDFLQFDYREFDDANLLLDKETGLLPGLVLELESRTNRVFGRAVVKYYGADIDYDGQDQSGVPVLTDTATRLFRIEALGGIWIEPRYGAAFSVYGGLGYHFWRRDIQPARNANGDPVSGLLEEYDWTFLILGTEILLLDGPSTRISLDGRLQHMLDAKMFAFLGDGLDFDLGEETGIRLSMPFSFQLSRNVHLRVEPYLSWWDIGRSNTLELTVGGTGTGLYFLEPRSETRNQGLTVMLQTRF